MIHDSWKPFLRTEFEKPYFKELSEFTAKERAAGPVYPPHEDVFNAFAVPFDAVKVVILGQDPYHGPGQAHGLCFSVRPGVAVPPSLRNVFKELQSDLGIAPPSHGCLDAWTEQGVFLLNTTLTVRSSSPGSHQGRGWETFTDEVVRKLSRRDWRAVFLLWGSHAKAKFRLIDSDKNVVITSAHPSPLSAASGFFGSRPFSQTNAALVRMGLDPVDWEIPASGRNVVRDSERACWDKFEQDGHVFVRTEKDLWCCIQCGSTKDSNNFSGLPDDSWAKIRVGSQEFMQVHGDFETCDEAVVLAVLRS